MGRSLALHGPPFVPGLTGQGAWRVLPALISSSSGLLSLGWRWTHTLAAGGWGGQSEGPPTPENTLSECPRWQVRGGEEPGGSRGSTSLTPSGAGQLLARPVPQASGRLSPTRQAQLTRGLAQLSEEPLGPKGCILGYLPAIKQAQNGSFGNLRRGGTLAQP